MCSVKKVSLKVSQNSQENTCAKVSFLIKLHALGYNFIKKETLAQACNFIEKEALAQVFSCEFYEIFRKIFFSEHLWWLLLYFQCVIWKFNPFQISIPFSYSPEDQK